MTKHAKALEGLRDLATTLGGEVPDAKAKNIENEFLAQGRFFGAERDNLRQHLAGAVVQILDLPASEKVFNKVISAQ